MTNPTNLAVFSFISLPIRLLILFSLVFPINESILFGGESKEKCQQCHQEVQLFSSFHAVDKIGCSGCHSGNGDGATEQEAHQGMEAYPGRMATVEKTCGKSGCHSNLVSVVNHSIMNTLDGMISLTREVFDQKNTMSHEVNLHHRLGKEGVDSYMRKLCVVCHLGNDRKDHSQNVNNRGGGCAACHLRTYSSMEAGRKIHPTLTLLIDNDRCFGCHSRSSRVSLNYIGLAEVDEIDPVRTHDFGYLPDGRLVEKLPPDVHSNRLACIDCHTMKGVMGWGERFDLQKKQVDIQCLDCHQDRLQYKSLQQLTGREVIYFSLYPDLNPNQFKGKVPVTAKGKTALFNLVEKDRGRFLRTKLGGFQIPLPKLKKGLHHDLSGHERLSCESCHSAWAPQCYGCHVSYDPKDSQWDHLEKKVTPGRWTETRWYLKNESPALGVTGENRIVPFVPGMNMSVSMNPKAKLEHKRIYASVSPHTTMKKGQSCESCHQSKQALGIISHHEKSPQNPNWSTPVGWIDEKENLPRKGLRKGSRSFDKKELERIQRVGRCLKCHPSNSQLYQKFGESLKNRCQHGME